MKEKLTLEKFLRDKLESEIQSFGDGNTEFHTRDLEQLINILDGKDDQISELKEQCIELASKVNFNVEKQFSELLEVCMTINNLSAEERLRYIRSHYKEIWNKIK